MGLTHSDFMQLFDEWAPTYDATVYSHLTADGFENYQDVLESVAHCAGANPGVRVVDVGAGTGNLSQVLVRLGADVVAVEPSAEMRRRAQEKLPTVRVLDGQFLALPLPDRSVDAVVSTYAFHHLTDEQKATGARELLRVLRPGGRVVLGDIAWADAASRQAMIQRFRAQGKVELVQEIEEEYYPQLGYLVSIFAREGCEVHVRQVNDWVWILMARR